MTSSKNDFCSLKKAPLDHPKDDLGDTGTCRTETSPKAH